MPNSSRNAKKIFYYHVNFHTPGGGQKPKCEKIHTFFFVSILKASLRD